LHTERNMEPLWSPGVATGGNQRQIGATGKPKKQANPCHRLTRLPETFHGKEGVDGSSPSEGFHEVPANWHYSVVCSKNAGTQNGHISGTRDVPRRLAAPCDTSMANAADESIQEFPAKRRLALPKWARS
jgi:hypothetical protein